MKNKVYRYTMPGGMVEQGESIKQGGARELFEETGLRVRTDDLEEVGKPFVVNPSIIIQYLFCYLDRAAPWQYIENREPDKLGPWMWMNLEQFNRLAEIGVYPNLNVTGHVDSIVEKIRDKSSLIDRYARDNSWLGWVHEKELRRMYGLNTRRKISM